MTSKVCSPMIGPAWVGGGRHAGRQAIVLAILDGLQAKLAAEVGDLVLEVGKGGSAAVDQAEQGTAYKDGDAEGDAGVGGEGAGFVIRWGWGHGVPASPPVCGAWFKWLAIPCR